VRHIFLDITTG